MSHPKLPYEGDLEKTALIHQLINIPLEKRDQNWVYLFAVNVPDASFRCGDPQVIMGPDGFPYFQLLIPEVGQPFECYVVNFLKEALLKEGLGIVLNAGKGQPDWVCSYGDLLNFYLHGEFYSTMPAAVDSASEALSAYEEAWVGQPSETYLPAMTRAVLRHYLIQVGVKDPKVLLMLPAKSEPSQLSLVFNISPDLFESEDHYLEIKNRIGWFLPRQYLIFGVEENAMKNHFKPL